MDKKLQVFISSTYIDLTEERQSAVEAILSAGHIPAGMELFKAGPTQEQVIKEWIEESDVYMLILGARYGSKNKDGISYTEWEYNLAKELEKPIFSIVLSDEYINQQVGNQRIKAIEVERSGDQFFKFRKIVESNLMIPINHIAEIKSGVFGTLSDIEKRYKDDLIGWIPGNYINKITELTSENKILSEKLLNRQDEYISLQKEISFVKDEYIGEYSFEHIQKDFYDYGIPKEEIEGYIQTCVKNMNSIEGMGYETRYATLKNTLEELNYLKENNNLIQIIFYNREKIYKERFNTDTNYSTTMYKEYLFPHLRKYNLGEVVNIRNQFTRSETFDFNEKGFKFLNLLVLRISE